MLRFIKTELFMACLVQSFVVQRGRNVAVFARKRLLALINPPRLSTSALSKTPPVVYTAVFSRRLCFWPFGFKCDTSCRLYYSRFVLSGRQRRKVS